MKHYSLIMKCLVLFLLMQIGIGNAMAKKDKIVVAYVMSGNNLLPNPFLMTHINYAFGRVNNSFDGITIAHEQRFREIAALKKINPRLKVVLSVGGWGAGNFSEMAADPNLRKRFAKDCKRVMDEYGIDGVDIDWEYPTQSVAKISSSPDDTKNFNLLMRDIRKYIGKRGILTAATVSSADYIDIGTCIKYMTYVNVMAYDMGNPPHHHAALYSSKISARMTGDKAVKRHMELGVPKDKLVLGMPFYARGEHSRAISEYLRSGYTDGSIVEKWSEESKVPYLEDKDGKMLTGFENTKSIAARCQYILDNDLLGGMYWQYNADNIPADKAFVLYNMLIKGKKNEK